MKLPLNLITSVAKHGTLEDILALNVVSQYVPKELRQALTQHAPMDIPLAEIPGETWVKMLVAVAQSWNTVPPDGNVEGDTSPMKTLNATGPVIRKCPKCNKFFLEE